MKIPFNPELTKGFNMGTMMREHLIFIICA